MRWIPLLLLTGWAPAANAQAPGPAASTAAPAAAEVDLLSIGGYRFTLSMPLVAPFERLLRDNTAQAIISDVQNVPVYFKGNTYRFHLPQVPGAPEAPPVSTSAARVPVLESEFGFFVLLPPNPGLFDSFRERAGRPESYARPLDPRLRARAGSLTTALGPEGAVHSLAVDSPRQAADQWRRTLAVAYRLYFGGAQTDALFIFKSQGGLARLSSAMERLSAEGRPQLAVSRGTLAARDASLSLEGRPRLEALERMGLAVSAVGLGEMGEWEDLQGYLRDRPGGVKFVSANLVVSSAPSTTVLPPTVVLSAGGLRIGFLGLTRPAYRSVLGVGKLKDFTLSDPVSAALRHIRALRDESDLVVVLSNLSAQDNARLAGEVRGIDLIIGDDEPYLPDSAEPKAVEVSDLERRRLDGCLLVSSEYGTAVNRLRVAMSPPDSDGVRSLRLRQSHLVLDESVPDHDGFPEFALDLFGVSADTQPALLPSARRLFPEGSPNSMSAQPTITSRDFWSLAASLAAERTGAEAAVLPVLSLTLRSLGELKEASVRDWFLWSDRLVTFELQGSDLQALVGEAAVQEARERQGLSSTASGTGLRVAVGGLGRGGTVHGVPIDPGLVYLVAGSELLLGSLERPGALARARNVRDAGELREEIIQELRSLARGKPTIERYRELMAGRALRESPLWKVNFRDISLNASNTKVVRDPAFSQVPNARVQGFDQQLVGYTAKIDVDYLFREYKWANNFVVEYSRARLQPPGLPEVVNTPTNRISFLTTGTRRVGAFPWAWLAQAYGPSLGFQFEGQVEKTPGLQRKQIYFLYPGVEFYNGRVIRSVELSANLKRDLSRDPPNNQYGLRARVLASAPVRNGLMTLQGEAWANYFVLTKRDTSQDLRLEGDANLKLQIPVYKHLTLAPFIDFYYFQLKTRDLTGYSAITGISLGFSRLWKPQYERF